MMTLAFPVRLTNHPSPPPLPACFFSIFSRSLAIWLLSSPNQCSVALLYLAVLIWASRSFIFECSSAMVDLSLSWNVCLYYVFLRRSIKSFITSDILYEYMDLVAIWSVVSKFEVAFVTLIAGLLIARLVGRLVGFILKEAELNAILKSAGFHPWSVEVGIVVERLIQAITVIIVLQQFDMARFVLEIVGLILGVVLLVGLLLSVRDVVPNLVAYVLLRKKLLKVKGTAVSIGHVSGRVEKIGFLRTILSGKEKFVVPHKYACRAG